VLADTIDDVDMTKSSTAIVSVPRSSTAAELPRNGNNSSSNRTIVHHLDSEEEKQEETEITNIMGRDRRARRPRESDSKEDEKEEAEDPTLSLMENEGPRSPSILSEPRGPVAIDDQSLMIAELAEPSQEDEELRRQNQELEKIVGEEVVQGTAIVENSGGGDQEVVPGTAIVENSGGGDQAQNAASSPFGRKERRFLMGPAFALLLVVGVILGVAIPLTTNNTACTNKSLGCLAELLLQNEVADAKALQDESSPQFRALRWLANNDTMVLDLDSATSVVLAVERYVLAVLYFATNGEGWKDRGDFLSASSVCEWFSGGIGPLCNDDDLVAAVYICKSKHAEVPVLVSKFRCDSPVYLPFYLTSLESTHGINSERTRSTDVVD
jgi:hypothetical protein